MSHVLPPCTSSRDKPPGLALSLPPLPLVFSPISFRGVTLKNRFVLSPMCMYSSQDGFLNDFHLVHLGAFALRGVALTIVEASAVSPEGRISPVDAGLWKTEHVPQAKKIVDFIHSMGGKAGIQLAHAGRKANTYPPWHSQRDAVPASDGGWPESVLGPSDLAYPGLNKVNEMTIQDINDVICKFADSARLADEAGFDVVEIHGAHGYLLHSFCSSKSNVRTDEYGGSFENRTRLIVQVFEAVRKVWPENKPVFVRLSCTDWLPEGQGWNLDQSIRLSRLLKDAGADLIDCSSGGLDPEQKIDAKPAFQVPYAAAIKKEAGIRTGAVGLIYDAKTVDEVVQEGKADLVFVAREFLRDPGFVFRCAKELDVQVAWSRQYERGQR